MTWSSESVILRTQHMVRVRCTGKTAEFSVAIEVSCLRVACLHTVYQTHQCPLDSYVTSYHIVVFRPPGDVWHPVFVNAECWPLRLPRRPPARKLIAR